MEQRSLKGGILIGGESRRMGQPKHLLRVAEGTLIERLCRVVAEVTPCVVLLGAGDVPPSLGGCPRLSDVEEAKGRQGPMAGVLAALRSGSEATWLIVSCDLPRLSVGALQWLVGEFRNVPQTWAVLARVDGIPQPFPGVFDGALLPELEARWAAGQRGLRFIADHPKVRVVPLPAEFMPCWSQANTPAEWNQLVETS